MTDEEIYQQIEEHSAAADALYDRIHEQVESSIVKHAQAKKRRKKLFTSIFPMVAVVIVVLSVVLPLTLQSPNPQQPQDDVIRYGDSTVLSRDVLDCNLKEYYTRTNQSLLYLDWYEYAEVTYTARYYEEGKEGDTVYLYETIDDGGYFVQLSVMKRNIVLESLDNKFVEYQTTNTGNVQIVYYLTRKSSLAKFEYQGYKYYLEVNDSLELNFLVEMIDSMINH